MIQKYKSSNLQAKPFQVQAIKSDQMRGSLEADQDQDQDHPQPLSNSLLENFRAKLDWRKETLDGWEDLLLHLELLISTTIIVTVIVIVIFNS